MTDADKRQDWSHVEDGDDEVYQSLASELQRTVSAQLDSIRNLQQASDRLLTLNAAIAAFFFTVLTATAQDQLVVFLAVSLLAFGASLVFCNLNYVPTRVSYGLGSGSLDGIEKHEIGRKKAYDYEVCYMYEEFYDDNDTLLEAKAKNVRRAVWSTTVGILVLTASLYRVAFPREGPVAAYTFLLETKLIDALLAALVVVSVSVAYWYVGRRDTPERGDTGGQASGLSR